MGRHIEKFILLLASSGLSDREVYQILRDLKNLDPRPLVDVVLQLREELSRSVRTMPEVRRILSRWEEEPDLRTSGIVTQIEQMLRVDAGLTVQEASREIIEVLSKRLPRQTRSLKPLNREGFSNWLRKLLSETGASKLLHIATVIRDRHVPKRRVDWPLRED